MVHGSKPFCFKFIIFSEWKTVLKWTHLHQVSSKFPDHREDSFWNALINGLQGYQVFLNFRFYSLIKSPFRSLPFAQYAQRLVDIHYFACREILCSVNSPHAHHILTNSKIMALYKNIRPPWICSSVFTTHAFRTSLIDISCPLVAMECLWFCCSWLFNLFRKFLKWRLKSLTVFRCRIRQSDFCRDDFVLLLYLATHLTIQRRTW